MIIKGAGPPWITAEIQGENFPHPCRVPTGGDERIDQSLPT